MAVLKYGRKRAILRAKQNNKCCYCGRQMTRPPRRSGRSPDTAMTIEHLRRKCDGGTNDWDNLALACERCNNERGAMDWLTYKSWRMGELDAV